jgi:hypothetical protein
MTDPNTLANAYRALADAAAGYCIVPDEDPTQPVAIYLTINEARTANLAPRLLSTLTVDRAVYWHSEDTGTEYATLHARLHSTEYKIQMYADTARAYIERSPLAALTLAGPR